MILSNHIIDGIDSELNDFKKNIPRIEFRGIMIFISEIKHRRGIKGNNIKICVPPLT